MEKDKKKKLTGMFSEKYQTNLSDFALFLAVMKNKLLDGTAKIFLNMTSKNGSKELVSLLQYCKESTLDNPEILVADKRLIELDSIVTEVKESEEWEAVQMNILEIGLEKGIEQGIEQGEKRLGLLSKKLLEENRLDDLRQALEDAKYRKKLYREYQI